MLRQDAAFRAHGRGGPSRNRCQQHGCADVAEENPLVKRLQEQSRKNKDTNEQAMREKYWREGYNSYFSFGYNQQLQKDEATGKWSLVTPENPIAKLVPKPNSIGK